MVTMHGPGIQYSWRVSGQCIGTSALGHSIRHEDDTINYFMMTTTNAACGRDHFLYVRSQWETTSQCNVVSHWLGAYRKWSRVSQLWQSSHHSCLLHWRDQWSIELPTFVFSSQSGPMLTWFTDTYMRHLGRWVNSLLFYQFLVIPMLLSSYHSYKCPVCHRSKLCTILIDIFKHT